MTGLTVPPTVDRQKANPSEPDVNFSSGPQIPGGIGTIALAVNMIPQVVTSLSGLKTMADFPAPAAIMADVRTLIADRRQVSAS